MSYKKKLVLMYVFVIVIPLLIFGISAFSINNKIVSIAKRQFPNTEEYVSNHNHRYFRDYSITIGEYPDLALNTDYNDLLFYRYADLLDLTITLDNQIIYQNSNDYGIIEDIETTYQEHHLETPNGQITIAFSHIKKVTPELMFRKVFLERILISLMVYFILHFLFLYIMLKSFLPDTKRLTAVANHISEGHYNFEVDVSRNDEIGEVYKAFDNMRKSLQLYENNRKELITNISHDLKTPIATIKGYVNGIKDGLASTPEKKEKYLSIIYNNTVHLDNLINDLFLYSKLDIDKIDFDFKPLNLDKYIDYYIDELKLDLEEKGIDIIWELPKTSSAQILGDGFRLRQALDNLVSNAVKHLDKSNKQILFSVTSDENTATLKIKDNGKGIKQEHLNHIFERFYRSDASRNTHSGSSGLGLAIVKQIIEKHNGQIKATSTYGECTTIEIILPLKGEHHG